MNHPGKLVLSVLLVFSVVIHKQAEAQVQVSESVFGNGGATISNGSNRILGTLGQTVIGRSSNASNVSNAGFWYQSVDFITSVEQIENEVLPKEFRLEQNYPNPFNPSTTIQFALPKRSEVMLKIFDLLGREVATLVDEELQPGEYKVVFEAEALSSGVYFYRINAEGFVQTRKLTLLK